jgi:hypothetical protein
MLPLTKYDLRASSKGCSEIAIQAKIQGLGGARPAPESIHSTIMPPAIVTAAEQPTMAASRRRHTCEGTRQSNARPARIAARGHEACM